MPSACQELPPVPFEISASFVTANNYDSKTFHAQAEQVYDNGLQR